MSMSTNNCLSIEQHDDLLSLEDINLAKSILQKDDMKQEDMERVRELITSGCNKEGGANTRKSYNSRIMMLLYFLMDD